MAEMLMPSHMNQSIILTLISSSIYCTTLATNTIWKHMQLWFGGGRNTWGMFWISCFILYFQLASTFRKPVIPWICPRPGAHGKSRAWVKYKECERVEMWTGGPALKPVSATDWGLLWLVLNLFELQVSSHVKWENQREPLHRGFWC